MAPRYAEPQEGAATRQTVIVPRTLISVRRRDDGVFVIAGPALQRLVRMADLTNPEAVDYLLGRLLRLGVPARLRHAGARTGDRAQIEQWSFPVGEGGVPLTADVPEEEFDEAGDADPEDGPSPEADDGTGAGDGAQTDETESPRAGLQPGRRL